MSENFLVTFNTPFQVMSILLWDKSSINRWNPRGPASYGQLCLTTQTLPLTVFEPTMLVTLRARYPLGHRAPKTCNEFITANASFVSEWVMFLFHLHPFRDIPGHVHFMLGGKPRITCETHPHRPVIDNWVR